MSHVLFLSHWYPSETTPILGTFVREHARAVSLINKVSVIHIEGVVSRQTVGTDLIYWEKDGPINVAHVKYPKSMLPKTTWLNRISGTLKAFREISKNYSKPDIIHANVYHSADLAFLLSRAYHIPVVLTEHSTAYARNLIPRSQVLKNRFFLNNIQLLMPVCRDLQVYMQKYGIKGKFDVVSNTIDTDIFHLPLQERHPSQQKLRMITVASLTPIKAIHLLLEAFSITSRKYPNLSLNIVGDGPEYSSLMEKAKLLNIKETITFLGVKSRNEIADLMREMDFFILTSLWENQPVVLLEAMASGLPVIAPEVGGIPEIVNPEVGILTKPGDVHSIAQAIETMIDNYANYTHNLIRQYAVGNFSYSVIGERFNQVYQSVIDEFRKTKR